MRQMKSIRNIAVALLVAAIGLSSCEDHRRDYMEDYLTMAYFRNGGEQEISLYRTGEDGFYNLVVCKSGADLQGTITVEMIPMNQDAVTIYNSMNYTDYTAIPRYLYSFWTEDEKTEITANPLVLTFGPDQSSQVVKVRMQTNAIRALMDVFPDRTYVLGFQLFSAEGKVSDQINLLVLTPHIEVPYLNFSNTGVYSYTFDKNSPKENVYSNIVKFGVDQNRWDFTCNLEVKGASWLDSYNAAYGTDYELLPAALYEAPASIHFEEGVTEKPIDVKIFTQGMPALRNYVVPLAVKNTSKQEFVPYVSEDPDEYIYMLHVLMTPEQLTLQSSQLSGFYNGKGDNVLANLVDGNDNTIWQSPGSYKSGGWAGDATWGFYIDIDLGEHPLDAFVLGYEASAIAVRCPTRIAIGVSNDGVNFKMVADVATADMQYLTGWHDLPLVKLDSKVRYIRMGLLETYINDTVQPLNIDTVDMTCEVAEIRLFGAAN